MSANTRREYRDFRAYCATLTDAQVLNVVEKEREGARRDPDRDPHFSAALDEAQSRGLWPDVASLPDD